MRDPAQLLPARGTCSPARLRVVARGWLRVEAREEVSAHVVATHVRASLYEPRRRPDTPIGPATAMPLTITKPQKAVVYRDAHSVYLSTQRPAPMAEADSRRGSAHKLQQPRSHRHQWSAQKRQSGGAQPRTPMGEVLNRAVEQV